MAESKNRRESVDINEDAIKLMMQGDIPAQREKEPPVANDETMKEPDTGDGPVAAPAARTRRRREQKDYGETFLKRRPFGTKTHTYLSMELHEKLQGILPVIAPKVTVPMFLDNLVAHHLETYRDEINEMYAERTRKPL